MSLNTFLSTLLQIAFSALEFARATLASAGSQSFSALRNIGDFIREKLHERTPTINDCFPSLMINRLNEAFILPF